MAFQRLAVCIFFAAALFHSQASAGTTYVDRPFPVQSGAPCFVYFDGYYVNASHIRDVNVDERPWSKYMGASKGFVEQTPYLSLRITFITNTGFEIRNSDRTALKKQEADLLKAIRGCR